MDRDLLSASVVGVGGERYPILEDDDECSGGGARGGTKGSTIYLYIENEKRKHRNSSQSETHNKGYRLFFLFPTLFGTRKQTQHEGLHLTNSELAVKLDTPDSMNYLKNITIKSSFWIDKLRKHPQK